MTKTNAIKTELKKHGINTKFINVKHIYSYCNDIYHIYIKSDTIDKKQVESLTAKFKDIDRDEYGNILEGGNTYISVYNNY